jgi:lambda family phage portal protein
VNQRAFSPVGRGLPPRRDQPQQKRSFEGAKGGRLTADWIVSPLSADAAIYGRLNILRDRSRDLERNNEWIRGFLRTLENNVLGENGIALQMRVRDANGQLDEIANQLIETAWYRWGRVGRCTLNRRQSWRDVQKLVVRSLPRDGEVMVRMVRQREGLRLQVLEADLLDLDYNATLAGGNEVRFGVEFDRDRAVVAYHLLARHPGDSLPLAAPHRKRQRIPAGELLHLFIEERCDQTRGFPWLVASMKGLRMLDGYSEAELVAARTAAAKMGFFTRKASEGFEGPKNSEGDLRMDASPGVIEELPEGVEFQSWDPAHPNQAFGDFIKSRLRGVASSLGVSYNTLTSDLEGVNFSSIRAGLLEEREVWKALQRWLIEHFCEPVFEAWLEIELVSGRLGSLPFSKFWKFNQPEFRGRRWQWVDPKKDIEAAILGIRAGLTSQRDVIAENGGDRFDVFTAQASDKDEAKKLGLTFPELEEGKTPPAKPVVEAPED